MPNHEEDLEGAGEGHQNAEEHTTRDECATCPPRRSHVFSTRRHAPTHNAYSRLTPLRFDHKSHHDTHTRGKEHRESPCSAFAQHSSTAAQQHSSTAAQQHSSTAAQQQYRTAAAQHHPHAYRPDHHAPAARVDAEADRAVEREVATLAPPPAAAAPPAAPPPPLGSAADFVPPPNATLFRP